jgi:hypothetical protein
MPLLLLVVPLPPPVADAAAAASASVVTQAMARFSLPVRMTLPLQAVGLLTTLGTERTKVCWLSSTPEYTVLLTRICNWISRLHYAALVPFGAHTYPAAARHVCSAPETSVMTLFVFAHLTLTLMVPILWNYWYEWSTKVNWLAKVHNATLSRRLPPTWCVLLCLPGLWWACIVLVAALPNLTCNADGWLVLQQHAG